MLTLAICYFRTLLVEAKNPLHEDGHHMIGLHLCDLAKIISGFDPLLS